jgi:hypothetical protein
MLHNGADHTTIAMHDQPTRKPLSRSVNRVTITNATVLPRADDVGGATVTAREFFLCGAW